MSKQYTLVYERPNVHEVYTAKNREPQQPHFFVNCEKEHQVVKDIADRTHNGLKLWAIYSLDENGEVEKFTIGLKNGALGLVELSI